MRTKFWYGVSVLASLVAGAGAAGAADLGVAPAPVYKAPAYVSDWAGFYLGVEGGYGWGKVTSANGLFDFADTTTKGGLFGGYAGYNWQYGSVVVGLEVDFDGADINGTGLAFNGPVTFKTNELGSARARLGYAVLPNWLIYGTAGLGVGHTSATFLSGVQDGVSQFGWTAGVGVEYKITNSWIARAEYLHYDFDESSTTELDSVINKVDVVKGGLSYKF
jgi:outer membrane immunogenic protein